MLIVAPICAPCVLYWALRRRDFEWRDAVLWTAMGWAVWVVILSEILSLPRQLTPAGVAAGWLAFGAASLVFALRGRVAGHRSSAVRWEAGEIPILCAIALLLAAVLATAILCPPNTWDAMDYHMPRVAMWAVNSSVHFFPTSYLQQLFLSPWAEYAMLHLYLTGGGDRFVNLVQGFSWAGCVVVASLIARQLGAGRLGQLLAALMAAAIPEGLLEASGAMNCAAVSLWLGAMVYFLLRAKDDPAWLNVLGFGAALGLAVLTKGTAYVIAPSLIIFCWWMAAIPARRLLLKRAWVAGMLALALNAPLYVRNWRMSGSPLGFPAADANPRHTFANSRISLSGTASNVIRNIALHLGSPSDRVNVATERLIDRAIRLTGADPNDPETTWTPFHLNRMSRSEILAGNPLHLVLIIAACMFALVSWRKAGRDAALFGAGLAAAFLVCSALLRWQPWSSRFHLPFFVLGSALIGVIGARWRGPAIAASALVFAAALPFAFTNGLRPLEPGAPGNVFRASRVELYFVDQHAYLESSFVAAARAAREHGCRSFGLDSSLLRFDYPMLALLGAGIDARVRHMAVLNESATYAADSGQPPVCAVVCLGCGNNRGKWSQYRPVGGRVSAFEHAAVFSASGVTANREPAAAPWADPRREIAQTRESIERDIGLMRSNDLGPAVRAVQRAATTWPGERSGLDMRLDELYTLRIEGEHIRLSTIPILRKDSVSYQEQQALLAAAEAIKTARTDLQEKVEALLGRAAELAQAKSRLL